MGPPLVVILHAPARADALPLTALLAGARGALARHQVSLFRAAGGRVLVVPGREPAPAPAPGGTFGERLAAIARDEPASRGMVVLGGGAVPLLTEADARRLVATAASGDRVALTNNRYSSDVCATGRSDILHDLPPLRADNALPRWLEDHAGCAVTELPGRQRLALDLDTPLDLALLALVPAAPRGLHAAAEEAGLRVPHLAALRAIAADPAAELLVAGRSGSATLRWLERRTRCRIRFLAEERGLRSATASGRPPRSTLGRLLDLRGPAALGEIVGELADGAILDSRVLLADRLGADEDTWPSPEDRFASDLLRPAAIHDPWLRALTEAAAEASVPVLLGAHTVVGPGVPRLLAPALAREASPAPGAPPFLR